MKKLGLKKTLVLTLFWLGYNFLWGSLLTVVIPSHVNWFAGSGDKAYMLSIILAVGAFIAMLTQPIAGALSDICGVKFGKRKTFIIAGTVVSAAALVIMGFAQNIALFIAAFLILEFAANSAAAGFQGLIPDTVPEEERGNVSSVLGVLLFLGTAASAPLFGILSDQKMYMLIYLLCMAVLLICSLVTGLGVREEPVAEKKKLNFKGFIKSFYVSPKKYPDFAWLVLTYFLFSLAFYMVTDYLQYYLADILHSKTPGSDSAVLSIVVLVCAVVTSVFGGKWSDRFGRKKIVLAASLLMAAATTILLIGPPFELLFAVSVLTGFGYGLYIGVQWAFVSDCLPTKDNSGKDMGIFNIAIIAPQVLAPVIGGLLFTVLTIPLGSRYLVLFALAFVSFVLCCFTVRGVKKVR